MSATGRRMSDRRADDQDFMDLLKEFNIKVDGFPHNEWVRTDRIWVGIGDTSYGSFSKPQAIAFVRGYVAGVTDTRKKDTV